MTLQLSVAVRNGRLDSIETTISTSPKLQLRSGVPPANCAAADSGILLAEITCPSDYLTNAASGSKGINGTWQVAAAAAGTIGHFRIKDSSGTTTHMQGTVTITGGGGDMTVDNTNVAISQVCTVSTFTLTDGNA